MPSLALKGRLAAWGALLVWGSLSSVSSAAQAQAAESGGAPEPAAAPKTPEAEQQAEEQRAVASIDQEARQHFMIGRTLYEAGRFQQAAEEFEQAYRLSRRPQLLYNVYVANREAGNLRAAIDALSSYLDEVPDAPDRINLKARLERMQAQLAHQIEQEERARRATEEAERARAASRTRTVKERSNVPFYVMGAGGALLAASLGTGLVARNKIGQLEDNCEGTRCPGSEDATITSGRRLAIATDVLWGVGAVSAVTGLVLFWTGALDREREVPVEVSVGPQGAHAHFKARF